MGTYEEARDQLLETICDRCCKFTCIKGSHSICDYATELADTILSLSGPNWWLAIVEEGELPPKHFRELIHCTVCKPNKCDLDCVPGYTYKDMLAAGYRKVEVKPPAEETFECPWCGEQLPISVRCSKGYCRRCSSFDV